MQKRYFIMYTAAGSAIFCFGLAWLGNVFGSHLAEITPQIHRFSLIFVGLAVVVILGVVALQIVRSRRGSDPA